MERTDESSFENKDPNLELSGRVDSKSPEGKLAVNNDTVRELMAS